MKYIVTIFGVFFALFLVLVSGAMNWRFGLSLGRNPIDAQIYGSASIAADGLKVLLPFFFYWAWQNGRTLIAATGLIVWLVATAYSITSALGFAALNRATVTGELAAKSNLYAAWQDDLDRKQHALRNLPNHRPTGVVLQKLDALRQDRRWSTTKACSDATLTTSRTFCVAYNELEAVLAIGREAEKLEAAINNLRTKIQGAAAVAHLKDGDAQASLIARIMQIDISQVQTGLIILIAGLVELGSALGLFLATSHGQFYRGFRHGPLIDLKSLKTSPKITHYGDIAKFALARIEKAPGSWLNVQDLYFAYHAWCEGEALLPLETASFQEAFRELCHLVGFENQHQHGVLYCRDVKLAAQRAKYTPQPILADQRKSTRKKEC